LQREERKERRRLNAVEYVNFGKLEVAVVFSDAKANLPSWWQVTLTNLLLGVFPRKPLTHQILVGMRTYPIRPNLEGGNMVR
jgi:hypothetical protein